jgi:hypothetical protein
MKAAPTPQPTRTAVLRKIIGTIALLSWLLAYIAVAVVIGDRIAYEHWAWKLLYFPIAGIGWIFPVKTLILWMHAKDAPTESPDV